jgi:alpha-aminoadipate carrier protein LysW
MVNCPVCDAAIDVDEDELDEGEVISCDECGATLTVTSVDPLELAPGEDDEDDEDEEDEDFTFDEDDEDEDEEEEDDEEEEEWK